MSSCTNCNWDGHSSDDCPKCDDTPTPPQPDTTDGEPIVWIEELKCPTCNRKGLFVATGALITCSQDDCPNPDYAAALKARDTRREAEAKSLAQQQGFLAGFRWGFNSVDEDVATEECRKWQATLKERTKDE